MPGVQNPLLRTAYRAHASSGLPALEEATAGLSAPELAFVDLVLAGESPAAAAESAGLGRAQWRRIMARPQVRAAVAAISLADCRDLMLPISVAALMRIMQSPTAPAAAVVSAVRLAWSAAGWLRPDQPPPREPPAGPAPPGIDAAPATLHGTPRPAALDDIAASIARVRADLARLAATDADILESGPAGSPFDE